MWYGQAELHMTEVDIINALYLHNRKEKHEVQVTCPQLQFAKL